MNSKSEELKEKLRQALNSTARVISGDFKIKENLTIKNKILKFVYNKLDNFIIVSKFIKKR